MGALPSVDKKDGRCETWSHTVWRLPRSNLWQTMGRRPGPIGLAVGAIKSEERDESVVCQPRSPPRTSCSENRRTFCSVWSWGGAHLSVPQRPPLSLSCYFLQIP